MDVLVIGGGAIGVCSAYYLAKKGLRVTIVELGEVASGCSRTNAGLIVPSHSIPLAAPGMLSQGMKSMLKPESPFYLKPRIDSDLIRWLWRFRKACNAKQMLRSIGVLCELDYASLDLFDRLITDESLDCNFRQDGWLLVYRIEKSFQKAVEETNLLKAHSVDMKILSRDETLRMEPSLRPEIFGGIFFPRDAHLNPEKFVLSLAGCLKAQGVELYEQTEVLGWEISNGLISAVKTNQGNFHPKQIVLATGAWSSALVKSIGFRLPVQPGKGYVISMNRTKVHPNIPLYLCEAKVVVTPLEDSLRLGGTMELAGMDFTINRRRINAMIRAAKGYLTQMEVLETAEMNCGLRPCSADGLPIIDRFPGYCNLIAATGHSMMGITQAPITGKLVSQLICEQTPDINLRPFSLSRFK